MQDPLIEEGGQIASGAAGTVRSAMTSIRPQRIIR